MLALKGAATGRNWSRVTKYIYSSSTLNLLSTLDPSSLVAKRHRCAFQFPGASDTNHLLSHSNIKDPEEGSFILGRLPGIEPELRVPQTPVITIIP